LQQAFPFDELSFFYRVGIAEARILQLDLDTKAESMKEVVDLEKKVEALMRKMAQDIPRGQAVHDLVQNMREAVQNASQTNPESGIHMETPH